MSFSMNILLFSFRNILQRKWEANNSCSVHLVILISSCCVNLFESEKLVFLLTVFLENVHTWGNFKAFGWKQKSFELELLEKQTWSEKALNFFKTFSTYVKIITKQNSFRAYLCCFPSKFLWNDEIIKKCRQKSFCTNFSR